MQRVITQDDVDEERHVRSVFRETAGDDMEVDAYSLRLVLDAQFKSGRLLFFSRIVSSVE